MSNTMKTRSGFIKSVCVGVFLIVPMCFDECRGPNDNEIKMKLSEDYMSTLFHPCVMSYYPS